MPVDPLTDLQRSKALRLGRGVKGGAAALPQLGAPDPTPRPPAGLPRLHPLIQAQDVTTPRPVASNLPVSYHRPGPTGRGQALMRRGFMNIVQSDINLQQGKIGPGVKKTLNLLKNQPAKLLDPKNAKNLDLAMNAGPNLQRMIEFDPQTSLHQKILSAHTGRPIAHSLAPQPGPERPQLPPSAAPAPSPSASQVPMIGRPGHLHPAGAMAQLQQETTTAEQPMQQQYGQQTGGARFNPATPVTAPDLATLQAATQQASLNPLSPAAVIPRIATETAGTLTGIGPGMYYLGSGLIHHPERTMTQMVQQLAHSYGQTIHHPLRQWEQDPVGFITNVLTPATAGAGAYVRATELASISDALRAGEITKAQAALKIGKTLMRPQKIQREINAGGVRANPASFKSAAAGLFTKHVVDPLTEKAIGGNMGWIPRGGVKVLQREFGTGDRIERFTDVSGKVGAIKRRDIEMQLAQRRALAEVKIGKAQPGLSKADVQAKAYAVGSAKTHLDVWHSLYDNGLGYDESVATHGDTRYVAIKKPPAKVNPKSYQGDTAVARQFKGMVETDAKKLEANPHDYTYIPKATWDRMQLFDPSKVPGALKVIDKGTQMIRMGRFLHPGYAAWAVQNGILHLSQAGMFAFRNAWQLRNEYARMTAEEKAAFDNAVGAGHWGGGGVARATQGTAEAPVIGRASQWLGGKWHQIDDAYWRRMSLIHELNHAGYHSAEEWGQLMRDDPQRFRTIAREAQQEAIDYSEMSPGERTYLAKLMTAYGWTRGATTYTMRYALNHPVQARIGEQVGKQGEQKTAEFYSGLNGLVPSWLRGYAVLGHGLTPHLLGGGVVNPAETAANIMDEVPDLVKNQRSYLASEEAPIPQSLAELIFGRDKYGNQIKGSLFKKAIGDAAKRFEPVSAFNTLTSAKKGGGTFQQGWKQFLYSEAGIPLEQMTDAKKTAALGMKDYESTMTKKDLIDFQHNLHVARIPMEIQQMVKAGQIAPTHADISRLKGDLEAVRLKDQYMLSSAQAHGLKSWHDMKALWKAKATVDYMVQHHLMDPQTGNETLAQFNQMPSDQVIEKAVSSMWSGMNIGHVYNNWKKQVKAAQPMTVTH